MTQIEAYRQVGYKGDPYKEAWKVAGRCRDAIQERLNEFVREAEDIRKQAIIEARQTQVNLMRTAENDQVRLNASKEIVGAKQEIDLNATTDNTFRFIVEGVDVSKFPKQ
jgi:hypothetical protein